MRLLNVLRERVDSWMANRHRQYLRQNSWKDLIPGSVIRYAGPPSDSTRRKIADYEGLTLMLKGVTGGGNPEPCFIPVTIDPPTMRYDPTTNFFLAQPDECYPGLFPLFYARDNPIKVGVKLIRAEREDFEVVGFTTSPQWDKVAKELIEEVAKELIEELAGKK